MRARVLDLDVELIRVAGLLEAVTVGYIELDRLFLLPLRGEPQLSAGDTGKHRIHERQGFDRLGGHEPAGRALGVRAVAGQGVVRRIPHRLVGKRAATAGGRPGAGLAVVERITKAEFLGAEIAAVCTGGN